MPLAFKLFLDALLEFTGDRQEVWSVILFPILLGAGLWILTELMYRTYDFTAAKAFPKLAANIRIYMSAYVAKHSYQYFADNFSGSITGKINDMASDTKIVIESFLMFFIPTIVAMAIGLSIFASLHPLFALVVLCWFSVHIGASLLMAKKCNNLAYIHSESRNKLTGKLVDFFTNIATVKAFARSQTELAELKIAQQEEYEKHVKMWRLLCFIRLFQGSFCFLMMGVFTTWLMIVKWQQGIITTTEVVYIFYTSWGLTMMSWVSGWQIPEFFKSLGVCQQAFTVIAEECQVKELKNAKKLQIKKPEIIFEQVSFNYGEEQQLFEEKNITIKAGQNIGLVGDSGSGKTSLVKLLLRFYDIDSGKITIDGQDISKVRLESLRAQIAYIPQDPGLFHRSIYDNIAYGSERATKAGVIKAAKQAYLHDFIMSLPNKYETLVGERGVKLSGGQRQRIAIARAILKDAKILILDEATSALDSVTEKYIQDSLANLFKDKKRTVIAIAHRLATLKNMDEIMVLDQGKIVEQGSHAALLRKKSSIYKKLWQLQLMHS